MKSLISWLSEKYPDWRFTSRNPDAEQTEDEEYLQESIEQSPQIRKNDEGNNAVFDLVYFIDGSKTGWGAIATAESKNENKAPAYPVCFGETAVAVCRLNCKSKKFERIRFQGDHNIILSLPKTIEEQRQCILWHDINLMIYPYDVDVSDDLQKSEEKVDLIKTAKEEVKHCMRDKEEEALERCLSFKGNKFIIIDGQFQSRTQARESDPILSIDKAFSYYKLHDDLRKEIEGLKDNNPSRGYRTKPSLIVDKGVEKTLWFVRLRDYDDTYRDNSIRTLTKEAGVLECALLGDHTQNDDYINKCSLLLRDLANPTCYGLDSQKRWRTHLYHMYLTELCCKQTYYNESFLMEIVYGN